MRLSEFIGLLDDDPMAGVDLYNTPIVIANANSEILYADTIRTIPSELLNANIGLIVLPDTAEDLYLTVTIEGYEQSFNDDGSYEGIAGTSSKDGRYIRATGLNKYRVWAKMSTDAYLDVEAEDEDEARNIAEEADGGDFIPDDDPYSGDWEITDVEPLD